MNPPLIGVSTSITVGANPERAYVNTAYLRAVQEAGGIPVLLPPQADAEALRVLWERLDGVVLTGGGDLDPARFDEPTHPKTTEVSPARDALEIELVERALRDDVPLLGICRGLQVLNVALGGSLHQDLPVEPIQHSQREPRDQASHAVKVMGEGTRLGRVLGAVEVQVNSMHHQGIKRLGRGLRGVAWAPDGLVEGIEADGGDRFVLAVQWHPEELIGHDAAARSLFAAVVDAARRRHR
ncbi:MAG TPA: gamma-glutamyl-gamma-aminobutyrate hydrolase family protein [Methylomirabilota bacterium]|nr:gamma-glutamyl-gamma-aminobutyrate hydrolase family protein [Methylomirabilota bacterium]